MNRRRFLTAFAGSVCLAGIPQAHAGETLTLGVVPQFDQRRVFAIWRPLVDELRHRTGLDIRLFSMLTVPEFEVEMARGTFDLTFASSFATQHFGYVPLAFDSEPLRGVIIVRKDSPIRTGRDLDGRTYAVPSGNALGPAVARTDIERAHGCRLKTVTVKTHSGVFSAVLSGQAQAGGAVEKTLRQQDASVQDQLRVVHTTRNLPPHVFSAHPRVTADVRERVKHSLLEMASGQAGRELLAPVPLAGLVGAQASDLPPSDAWGITWVDTKD